MEVKMLNMTAQSVGGSLTCVFFVHLFLAIRISYVIVLQNHTSEHLSRNKNNLINVKKANKVLHLMSLMTWKIHLYTFWIRLPSSPNQIELN